MMSTSTSTMPSSPSRLHARDTLPIGSKVEDAQEVATVIPSQDSTEDLTDSTTSTPSNASATAAVSISMNLVQAMQAFTTLQEELTQLQRESQLTQRALVATQCSQTCLAKRLEKIQDVAVADDDTTNERMISLEREAYDLEERCIIEENNNEEEEEGIMEDIPSPEDDNLEQEIMNILPTKSRSLGVGLLGDMEQCIVEWQQTFRDLNDQHEYQVQACQADLERLHVRLDAMQALHPTGMEAEEAAQRARDQLEELVKIVEEFPSKARVEALKRELAQSKQVGEQTQIELARAMEELEDLRQREKDLLRRLEVATRPPILLQRPKNGPVPTVRLLRHTKKKLQKLFHLDRKNNNTTTTIHKQQNLAPVHNDDEANSSTSPSISEGALLDSIVATATSMAAAKDNGSLANNNTQPSLENEVDMEELSVTDSLEDFHRHDILSVYATSSPSKSHSAEEDDLDLCKMDTDDTTSTSEVASYMTETETDSSSGTPPPKLKKLEGASSKTLFHMAKNFLWVQ